MKAYDHSRIVFYGRNDWAVDSYKDRIITILSNDGVVAIDSINDAIEAYQCKVTVEGAPKLFEKSDLKALQESSRLLFADACRFINRTIQQTHVDTLYEETELQYAHLFLAFLAKTGSFKHIPKEHVKGLLIAHPELTGDMLELKALTYRYGPEIREAILKGPPSIAELIIRRLATENASKSDFVLPEELTNDDLDSVMIDYLNSSHSSPNYVGVLVSWPSASVSRYKPSPDVQVLARRREKEDLKKLFSEGFSLRYATGACVIERQKACKGIKHEGHDLVCSFGSEWLESCLDPASIMNNCIYVFDYVDSGGIMTMPALEHDESTLFKIIGIHAFDEYRVSPVFHVKNNLAIAETLAYNTFLKAHGTSIESALEWVFNQYFEEEFKIAGFSLFLPSESTTWLDKCKSIGPEIERVIKAYKLYAKRGKIDDAYFPFEGFKSFDGIRSLSGDKYAVAGEQFEMRAHHLFSDQSLLAYVEDKGAGDLPFFDLLLCEHVTRTDFLDILQPIVKKLIGDSVIRENELTGALEPTLQAYLLKVIWDNGAIPLRRCNAEEKRRIKSLASEGVLEYRSNLFTPDEAAYLNYVFNDATFSNSLGLRNRYDHANRAIADPNTNTMQRDYYQLLTILIAITIKINEELQIKTGHVGLTDLVDWPLYDESIVRAVTQL